jgi:ribosomal protein S18 acetylase RimI-like enzyme
MSVDHRAPLRPAAATVAIRSAGEADLRAVACLHAAAFPGFFLTSLGTPFLRAYYRMVLDYEGAVFLVAENEQRLAGFVAGFVAPKGFYGRMKARKRRLLLPILLGLLMRPSLLPRVLGNAGRVRRASTIVPAAGEHACELSSLAVAPDRMRHGIGRALVRAFLAAAESKQARCVYLTTDAEGNEAAQRFYEELGFRQTRRLESPGKRSMTEYSFAFVSNGPQDGLYPC